MIPLTRLLKGSISSARPSVEKTGQGCSLMIGSNFGSTAMRCSRAAERRLDVVRFMFETLEGETSERGFWVTTRWVMGDMRGALDMPGAARRVMAVGAME